MKNINTEEKWDEYHERFKGGLNYPEKFKFISRELLSTLPKDAKVLELACGWGYLLRQIKSDHPEFRLEGNEFSGYAVNYVNSTGIPCKKGIVPKDLKDYSDYDCVIATEFLEHLDDETRLKTIKEIYRILKKGGKAIFTVPDNILPPSEEPFHLICYTRETFQKFLMQVFDFSGVTSKEFLVSDIQTENQLRNPQAPKWGFAPFLIGIGYKK
jgi:cyclopropane fatty-acyl-phospholipid synthase-like methyltransferase